MKLLCISILLSCLLLSCSKNDTKKTRGFIELNIEGSGEQFIWEEVNAVWLYHLKTAKLAAVSDQLTQIDLDLNNITDTGIIPVVTIKEINYTDAISFRPHKIITGYIRIIKMEQRQVTGEFNVELESNYQITEKRRIKGSFGIVN